MRGNDAVRKERLNLQECERVFWEGRVTSLSFLYKHTKYAESYLQTSSNITKVLNIQQSIYNIPCKTKQFKSFLIKQNNKIKNNNKSR